MPKQVLIYKRQRDAKQRCTTFRVDQPSYKFTLETCDDLVATISDNRGNRIASVDVDHHAIVSKVGTYNVCVIGDGVGTLYVEWTSDTAVDERCCQDVQEYLTTYIDEKIVATRVSVSAGDNVTVVENDNDYKVSSKNTITTLVAGDNISIVDNVTDGNHAYTISSTGGGDSKETIVTAGTNIKVTDTGTDGNHNYTIDFICEDSDDSWGVVTSSVAEVRATIDSPTPISWELDLTQYNFESPSDYNAFFEILTPPQYSIEDSWASQVDFQISKKERTRVGVYVTPSHSAGWSYENVSFAYVIVAKGYGGCLAPGGGGGGGGLPSDFDIVAGNNVQVVKNGNRYTVSATDTIPDVNKAYVDQQIEANKTVVQAGTNVTVTKNGNTYTVSATDGGGGGLPADFDIVAGNNVQVSKSGNKYTVSATDTDTITTVKQGTNVTVTKSGNEYTVNAEDAKLKQQLVVTCDIGGIASGTTYPVGTSLEDILRALLTCTTPPPQPDEYILFTSEITDMSTWNEIWHELRASDTLGEYIINLADTYEEHPVKFDVPANMPITDVQLYNRITAEWVTTRDFNTENITRTIDGVNVPYVRYTDNREMNGIGRPVKLIWTV